MAMQQVCFPFVPETRHAELSVDRLYRYVLYRSLDGAAWDAERSSEGKLRHSVLFVMLNPSIADERTDDPTVLKCMKFGRRMGMDRLVIVNLFAFRSTDPKALKAQPEGFDVIGPDNNRVIMEQAKHASKIVCAWGNHGSYLVRSTAVKGLIAGSTPETPTYFKVTNSNEPAHPLYQRDDAPLLPLW